MSVYSPVNLVKFSSISRRVVVSVVIVSVVVYPTKWLNYRNIYLEKEGHKRDIDERHR